MEASRVPGSIHSEATTQCGSGLTTADDDHNALLENVELQALHSARTLPTQHSSDEILDSHDAESLHEAEAGDRRAHSSLPGRVRNTSIVRQILKDWALEALSLLISLIALLLTVIIIRTQEGKPIRNVAGPLTLNAMVAILTSVVKASLLMPVAESISELKWLWFTTGSRVLSDMVEFDLASRGPRGSLRLLFRFPFNRLVCLGAFITLASIGTDAVTQLVVQPYDCFIDQPGLVTLGRTNNYSTYDRNNSYMDTFSVDPDMYLAIFDGILHPATNDSANLPQQCASGHCSFSNNGTYSSLALCASVSNISDQMVGVGNDVKIANSWVNVTYHGSTMSTAEVNRSASMWNEATPLFEFEAITWRTAFKANIFPCVQTFTGTHVVDSQIHQTLLSTTILPRMSNNSNLQAYYSLAGNISSFPHTDCSPIDLPQGSKTIPAHQLEDGRYYVIPQEYNVYQPNQTDTGMTGAKAGPQRTVYFDSACTWTFGIGPTSGLHETLGLIFGTQASPQIFKLTATYGTAKQENFWIQILNSAAESGSVQNYMDGLARSMTASLRRNGDASGGPPLLGTLQMAKTCVRFKWEYLLWNTTLLLATVAFVTATICRYFHIVHKQRDHFGKRGPWKSSATAMLWCDIVELRKPEPRKMDSMKEINHQSELLRVQLMRQSDPGADEDTGQLDSIEQHEPTSRTETSAEESLDTTCHHPSAGLKSRWILRNTQESSLRTKTKLRKWAGSISGQMPL